MAADDFETAFTERSTGNDRDQTRMPRDSDADTPTLLELLPEYYRENPGEMGPGLKIADEMIANVGAHLHRAGSRLNDDLLLAFKERWFPSGSPAVGARRQRGSSVRGGGTRRELLRWFEIHAGRIPSVWAGFEVRSVGVDHLQVRRSRRLAVVLVWNPEGLSESCQPPVLSPDMIPLRTRLQLILPMSENEVRISCHGCVLRARVLFDSHARDADV